MKKRLLSLLLGSAMLFGTTHCFDVEEDKKDKKDDPNPETVLKLKQVENGNLLYCEDDENCKEFPYDGECAIIEIRIDTITGETCETCITEDDDRIDMGCNDNSVGCVLVTLPEPDCVVCAYVNGAIIYSTCVGPDMCYSDYDCTHEDGIPGYCYDGQCFYDPMCYSNYDCPAGFECVFAGTPQLSESDDGCNSEENCASKPTTDVPYQEVGTCVPVMFECEIDADCPDTMVCEMMCTGSCGTADDNNNDCSGDKCSAEPCTAECSGYCVPEYEDPCSEVRCKEGYECVVIYPSCEGDHQEPTNDAFYNPCAPIAECIPSEFCFSDEECPDNMICEMYCDLGCDPDHFDNCNENCYGYCVEDWVECEFNQDCYMDFGCGENMDCAPSLAAICLDGLCQYGDECYTDEEGGCEPGYSCVSGSLSKPESYVAEPGICMWTGSKTCEIDEDCYFEPSDCTADIADCHPPVNACFEGECIFEFNCSKEVLCDAEPPTCAQGMVASIIDLCWGPCVWPEQCIDPFFCNSDDDCLPGYWCATISGGLCVPEETCRSNADCYDQDPSTQDRCKNSTYTCAHYPNDIMCSEAEPNCPDNTFCMMEQYNLRCVSDTQPNCGPYGVCAECDEFPYLCEEPKECFRSGCNGEICSDMSLDTACVDLPEYACYDEAECTMQPEGICGFKLTDELKECLAQYN